MTDFNIYTNRVPWALLTEDEREQFMAHDGPLMKYDHLGGGWLSVSPWHEAETASIYRAVAKKPEIPWEHIDRRWNAWAMDESGRAYFYTRVPQITLEMWRPGVGEYTNARCIAIDTTGINWSDSLVIRPGYGDDDD